MPGFHLTKQRLQGLLHRGFSPPFQQVFHFLPEQPLEGTATEVGQSVFIGLYPNVLATWDTVTAAEDSV